MCGIIGYIGSNYNAKEKIMQGLHHLEYRGYDSTGIALVSNKDVVTYKNIGNVSSLEAILPNIKSNIGIGHTRWATHGAITKENSHPHDSNHKRFSIVHNGIIENYEQIKNEYLSNYFFLSQTDSEIFANLLEYLSYNHSTIEALRIIKSIVKGSYAILIIDHQEQDKIYFIKNLTPLIILKGENNIALASDIINIDKEFTSFYSLEDHEFGYISQNKISIFQNLKVVNPKFSRLTSSIDDTSLDGFSSYMEKEIHQEPSLIKKIIDEYCINDEIIIDKEILSMIKSARKVFLCGCGSSLYSCKIGRYFLIKHAQIECEEILSSEAIYNFPLTQKGDIFIFVSQSGETLDVINLVKIAKAKGYKCISICNSTYSTLVRLCDKNISLLAGKEISVASTKAFLSQSLVFYLLSKAISNNKIDSQKISILQKNLNDILSNQEILKAKAKQISTFEHVFFLGRNIDYFLCLEGSLKLKEISYIHAESFPAGELKHGTLALISNKTLVISLISQDYLYSIMKVNIKETSSRGAININIIKENLPHNEDDITLKIGTDEDLIIFQELMILQLISYYVSQIKGNDIDHPRNLAKSVTVE